jgi:uncharacterized 2Fe-2S/4Fe-4S cluster protein (DUF4445 family)
MIQLHYKSKSYDLTLFDNYYITTVFGSGKVESILNALQSGRINRFKQVTNTQFTVTHNGVEIDCNDVHTLLLNQFN